MSSIQRKKGEKNERNEDLTSTKETTQKKNESDGWNKAMAKAKGKAATTQHLESERQENAGDLVFAAAAAALLL